VSEWREEAVFDIELTLVFAQERLGFRRFFSANLFGQIVYLERSGHAAGEEFGLVETPASFFVRV